MEQSYKAQKNHLQQLKLKLIQYSINLTSQQILPIIIFFCVIIQNLQLISVSLVTPIKFSSLGLNYFKYIASFLYPEYYLRTTAMSLYLIPIFFALTVTHITLLLFSVSKNSRLTAAVHYLFFLTNTVLTAPSLLINISILACNQNNPFTTNFTCFQSFHIVYVIFACINTIWLIVSTIFVFLVYASKDPFSNGYFTTSSNIWILAKMMIKIAPSIYLNVDPNLKFSVLYLVSFAGINAVYFAAFKIMWRYFRNNLNIQRLVIHCQTVVIFVTGFFILQKFMFENDSANIVFIASWAVANIVAQFMINFYEFRKSRIVEIYMKKNSEEQDEQQNEQSYFQLFNHILYSAQRKDQKFEMLYILKLHTQKCDRQDCYCRQIIDLYTKAEQRFQNVYKQMFYKFVNQLIDQVTCKFKKNNGLKIISAYVSFYKLNQKTKSVHNLYCLLKSSKLNLTEQLSIRKLFYQLKNKDNSVTSFHRFVQYSQHLWVFQNQAEIAIDNCKNYWIQLVQQDCEISKLWRMTKVIQSNRKKLKRIVEQKILQVFPHNLHTIKLYNQLLCNIYRNPQEHYLKKHQLIQKQLQAMGKQLPQQTNQITLRQNEQTAILCAVECEQVFQFIRVSSNIVNILHVRNKDLINKNINCLMPEIYHQFHDSKIKSYLQATDTQIQERNAQVYLIGWDHDVVQIMYKVKVMASTTYGLQLITFLKKIPNQSHKKYLIYYYQNQQDYNQIKQTKTSIVKLSDLKLKSGDIIHIDPQLKKLLYSQEQAQEYKDNDHPNIADIVPDWDVKLEEMLSMGMGIEKDSTKYSHFRSVAIVRTDQIRDGVFVKYMQFNLSNPNPMFQINFNNIMPNQQKQSRIFKNTDSQVNKYPITKNLESQNSRFGLIQYQKQAADVNYESNLQNQQQVMDAQTIQSNKPYAISNKIVLVLMIAIFSAIVSINIMVFLVSNEQYQAQKLDYQLLNCTEQVKISIFRTSLSILLTMTNITSNDSYFISQITLVDSLSELTYNIREIYDKLGIQNLNNQIQVSLTIIKDDLSYGRVSTQLNSAVSYLIQYLSCTFNTSLSPGCSKNLLINLDPVYKALLKIANISKQLTINKYESIHIKQILFQSFTLVLITALVLTIIIRIFRVGKFVQLCLYVYTHSVNISIINQYITTCEAVQQRLNGVIYYQELQKEENIQEALMQLESCINNNNLRQSPIVNKEQQNEQSLSPQLLAQQQQQQQKLIKMKKQVTFQESYSKLSHVFTTSIIYLIWLSVFLILKLDTNPIQVYLQRLHTREVVRYNYEALSAMQRVLLYLYVHAEWSGVYNTSIAQLQQNVIQMSSIDPKLRQQVKIHQLLQAVTQLNINPKSIQFAQAVSHLHSAQRQLMQHNLNNIKDQYEKTINSNRPSYKLVILIFMDLLLMFLLTRIIIHQQDVWLGCSFMLEMLHPQPQKIKAQHK